MTSAPVSTPAITLDNVWYRYDAGPPVLEGVTLKIPDKEFIGVVGPNAGGKSTLLKVILGLYEPFGGRVRVLGESPARARRRIGYVPQHPAFSRDFPIDVMHAVLMGRLGISRPFGGYTEADRAYAVHAMGETEITALADRHINTLSAGQLQRLLVARALACDPQILLLDEPTSNIDQRVETDIFDYLKEFSERMTIVVVSHDIGFISRYVDRVACLNKTLICHDTADIDGRIVQELYGADVQMVAHQH
ncbi:MAG: High-affinity zinc uptake system ATP-binding protein ZnuC [Gammaproteobacteria bacterium]|nr:High-affinity zinc uptake system ATP-binding protein ZnuC [Gammaproteobacteria bacterium]